MLFFKCLKNFSDDVTLGKDILMKITLLFLIGFLFLLLSCSDSSRSRGEKYVQFDHTTCNANTSTEKTADIDELDPMDSSNVGDYTISGTCKRDKSEVRVYVTGHPLDQYPICSRKKWEISADITGIVNKKERIQIAVSQAGDRGLLCKSITNYFVCPDGYIGVPELSGFTSTSFCAMKYEAKVQSGKNLPKLYTNEMIKAEALANGKLIQRVTEANAIKFCQENGQGYDLINNKEWQTIARYIEQEPVNWSKGDLSIGSDNRLNIGNIAGIKETSSDGDINDKKWSPNKRTHKLTNTEYIWDFAGNIAEIVKHEITSLEQYQKHRGTGYVYQIGTRLHASLRDLFGPDRDYTIIERDRTRSFGGLGYIQVSRFDGGLLRGGFNNKRTAGIFSADTSFRTDRVRPKTGFRCVYHP